MKHAIRTTAGALLFESEAVHSGIVLEQAVRAGADLGGAWLASATLDGLCLAGARLSDAALVWARLVGTDLRDANLAGARLRGADLARADLCGADLRGAGLEGVNLDRADLAGADLRGADLRGANLAGANLAGANLEGATRTTVNEVRADLHRVLGLARAEAPALLQALRDGRLDGSGHPELDVFTCLIATIARIRGVHHEELPGLSYDDETRLADSWFVGIRPGHTPENHAMARIAAGWIEAWLAQ